MVVLGEHATVEYDSQRLDNVLLDTLLRQVSSLASVYHRPEQSFLEVAPPPFLSCAAFAHCPACGGSGSAGSRSKMLASTPEASASLREPDLRACGRTRMRRAPPHSLRRRMGTARGWVRVRQEGSRRQLQVWATRLIPWTFWTSSVEAEAVQDQEE